MGKLKPMLPIGGASAIEIAAARMRNAGVDEIVVVAGHEKGKITREARRLGCRCVYNPDYKSGMFSSVRAGIAALTGVEAFFILPADIPLVKPATYGAVRDAFREASARPDAAYPSFLGERGHPPLVSRSMIEPILSWEGGGGLQGFFREFPCIELGVPVADRAVMLDMDAPEDYRALQDYAKTEFFPDDDECAELLKIALTSERAARHSRVVAGCAMLIAEALSASGAKINLRLLRAGALLHDIAKGQKDHEARGAKWLRKRGYAKVARLVASHKELPPRKKLGEAELLYLADKMTDGTSILSLEGRLKLMESRFAPGSDAMAGARRRMAAAALVRKKVEEAAGMPLEKILGGEFIGR